MPCFKGETRCVDPRISPNAPPTRRKKTNNDEILPGPGYMYIYTKANNVPNPCNKTIAEEEVAVYAPWAGPSVPSDLAYTDVGALGLAFPDLLRFQLYSFAQPAEA